MVRSVRRRIVTYYYCYYYYYYFYYYYIIKIIEAFFKESFIKLIIINWNFRERDAMKRRMEEEAGVWDE